MQLRIAIREDGSNSADLKIFESAAQSALAAARALAYEMRHRSEHDDPIEAARVYTEMILTSARIEVSWIDTRVGRGLPPEAAQEIVRGLKEAVLNVVRHAAAARVEINVGVEENELFASIQDDGIGLPTGQSDLGPSPLGLGLTASAEGMARIGGAMQVSRPPAGGTLVRLAVPLK